MFDLRLTPLKVVLHEGAPRWCSPCTQALWASGQRYDPELDAVDRAIDGPDPEPSATDLDEDTACEGLRHLASLVGVPRPPGLRPTPLVVDLPSLQRDSEMLARIAAPSPDALRQLLPRWTWTQWLQRAGVLDDLARTARGTVSTATDGHPCRSMLERSIEEYFISAGIEHDVEPLYPWHAQFNATGLRRADWLLPGGVYVEAAGMMSEPDYREKMDAKRALAEERGIGLMIVEPKHLGDLAVIFGRFTGAPLPPPAMDNLF